MTAPLHDAAIEAAKVLDCLAVVSHDLACHGKGQSATDKVLTAQQVAEVCAAIDDGVRSLRRILQISHQNGQGLLER